MPYTCPTTCVCMCVCMCMCMCVCVCVHVYMYVPSLLAKGGGMTRLNSRLAKMALLHRQAAFTNKQQFNRWTLLAIYNADQLLYIQKTPHTYIYLDSNGIQSLEKLICTTDFRLAFRLKTKNHTNLCITREYYPCLYFNLLS